MDLLSLELAAAAWWERLNTRERKAYVKAHPRSKYKKDLYKSEKTKPTKAIKGKTSKTKKTFSYKDWMKDDKLPAKTRKTPPAKTSRIKKPPSTSKPAPKAAPKANHNEDMVTFCIGDIHGSWDKLQKMFDQCRKYKEAHGIKRCRAVFLGDYIDRGPDSYKVLERFIKGDKHSPFNEEVFLRGNHEQMMIDALNNPEDNGTVYQWLRNGGEDTLQSFNRSVSQRHKEWLENLPHAFEDERHFYVHAGVNPTRDMHNQDPAEMLWIREKFLRHPDKLFELTSSM